MAVVDETSYRKDHVLPVGTGYGMRPSGMRPTSVVIHTTNSPKQGTAFEAEAQFLCDSKNVSAHYLVGKSGQIALILPPDLMAWHAGNAVSAWANTHSIGIENHVSQGEQWTGAQRDSLTWLVRRLMLQYVIAPAMVETHRKIALPKGRKSDPEAWPDPSFYAWQAALLTPPPKRYQARRIYISQRSEGGLPYAGELQPGEVVEVDKWYANSRMVHLKDDRGFVSLDELEALP